MFIIYLSVCLLKTLFLMGVLKKQLFSAHIKSTFEFETNVLCPCKLRPCVCVCIMLSVWVVSPLHRTIFTLYSPPPRRHTAGRVLTLRYAPLRPLLRDPAPNGGKKHTRGPGSPPSLCYPPIRHCLKARQRAFCALLKLVSHEGGT